MNRIERKRREICFVRVDLSGYPGQVRDITEEGMKLFIMGSPEMNINEKCKFRLIPDESLGVESFMASGEVRWMKKRHGDLLLGITVDKENHNSVMLTKLYSFWK